MEYNIVQSQAAKPARAYCKRKDIEVHKEFILQKHEAGEKQEAILAALKEEKGFDIKPYNLKRILGIWGVSHKNLTKKRRLHIRRAIDERRRTNNSDLRVKFGRSNRMLKDEEIEEIMSLQSDYFEDVIPSPGDIEFSSPLPSANSIEEEEEEEEERNPTTGTSPTSESPDTDIGNIQAEGIENDQNGAAIDNDVRGDEEEASPFDQTGHMHKSVEGVINRSEETNEDLQKVIINGIKELGIEDNQEDDFYDDEDFEIVTDIDVLAETEDGLFHGSPNMVAPGWSLERLRRYSRLFESEYLDWVNGWKAHSAWIVTQVDMRRELGMSDEEASEDVWELCESGGDFFIPYKVCMDILRTETSPLTNKQESESNKSNGRIIVSSIDKLFSDACAAADDPFLFSLEYQADRDFRRCVVHLPRIIREYGYQSFFTALCLQGAFEMLAKPGFDRFRDNISPFAGKSIEIFETIGMGCDRLSWCDRYHALSESECPQRNLLLQRLQVRYGRDYSFMIRVNIWKLYWMIQKGGRRTQTQYTAIQKLQSKIFDGLGHVDLDLKSSWSQLVFASLVGLCGVLRDEDNIILANILQRRISGADVQQITGMGTVAQDRANVWGANLSACALALGLAYSRTEKHTLSLEMLIRAYGTLPLYRSSVLGGVELALYCLCRVADTRGPVLYEYLNPVLTDACKRFKKNIANSISMTSDWRKMLAKHNARRKSQLHKNYMNNIPALQSCNRFSTPDLQQYLYYQALDSWACSEGMHNILGNIDLGGSVMEWEETGMVTGMQVDIISTEEELEMISQRYREAEAAGLVDENGNLITSSSQMSILW
ncbi:hypothetical protein AOL_s00210g220 [Orbilia oligospora ATCC 24927]|uniref:Clr5 domain-containing protein n=1 Tax=Arthrobotrys oligospora (strain ATCC 24927 / CBS 115.81 / DSM 1491) TaxID=756982 RepID=G1XS62_ARTOA|nr:hypothetical protein AOL_s00210g220 [Orbilia oligospora ATCC 24927]EGX44059.1 hypothetical protein AOL_s00210g220 [Orbilia oligospora ATCC 24927]